MKARHAACCDANGGAAGARPAEVDPLETRQGTVPKYLTAQEVADRLAMSVWWVYEHGAELGLVKFGGANRYLVTAVDEYEAKRLQRVAKTSDRPVSVGSRQQRSARNRRRKVALLDAATGL